MPPLTYLTLNGNQISDEGVAEICRLRSLEEIRLGTCFGWFADKTGKRIAASDRAMAKLTLLPNLRSLRLSNLQLTDFGLTTLSRCPELKSICLEGMLITDAALQRFVDRNQTGTLVIDDCPKISAEQLKKLQETNPKLRITWIVDGRHRTAELRQ